MSDSQPRCHDCGKPIAEGELGGFRKADNQLRAICKACAAKAEEELSQDDDG